MNLQMSTQPITYIALKRAVIPGTSLPLSTAISLFSSSACGSTNGGSHTSGCRPCGRRGRMLPILPSRWRAITPTSPPSDKDPETGVQRNYWFATAPDRPLFAFAGLWTPWRGVRKVRDGEPGLRPGHCNARSPMISSSSSTCRRHRDAISAPPQGDCECLTFESMNLLPRSPSDSASSTDDLTD